MRDPVANVVLKTDPVRSSGGWLGQLVVLLALGLVALPVEGVLPTPQTNASGHLVPQVLPVQTNVAVARPSAPPAAEPDFTQRNMEQRWWLVAVMAGLLGIAGWYRSRAVKEPAVFPGRGGRVPPKPEKFKP